MNAKQKTVFTNDCLEVLVMIVEMAEETGNCRICSGDDGDHHDSCPYPKARQLLESVGLCKGDNRDVG